MRQMSAGVCSAYRQLRMQTTHLDLDIHTVNLLLAGQRHPQRPEAHKWGKAWSTEPRGIPLNQHTNHILPFSPEDQQIQCDPSSHQQSKSAATQQIRVRVGLPSGYRLMGSWVPHVLLPTALPVSIQRLHGWLMKYTVSPCYRHCFILTYLLSLSPKGQHYSSDLLMVNSFLAEYIQCSWTQGLSKSHFQLVWLFWKAFIETLEHKQ